VSVRTLLVGPAGHGGEGVYMQLLAGHPPEGIEYVRTGGFHEGGPGVRCQAVREVLLNRVVHPLAVPDMGFRALRLVERFDLVHVHAHPVSLRGLRGAPLVMSEGSSAAVYIGEYLGWDDARLGRGLARTRRMYRGLRIADRLLTLERTAGAYVFSDWAREINLRWGADPAKLEVIAPGFPTPPAIDRADHEHFTVVFVGGDFERKGGFELVAAFAQAVEGRPELRLVLAGSDPAERNPDRLVHEWVPAARRAQGLQMIAALERTGALRRLPWVSREDLLTEIYPGADAFAMPTHAEGFGFTNVEAMSFGLPVVTSTAGPAAEIVDDGRTGLLVAPGDVDGLRDALLRLAGDPAAARRMGDAARAEFLRRFTVERFRTDLGAFYRRALETA
jgi:glycosyltransferase involved in cell wall biosynthesis